MSDLRVKTEVSQVPHGNQDGIWRNLRSTRDGAPFTCHWITAHALEGRAFIVNSGTGTSPVTGNAAFAAAEQDVLINVPTGTAIIPTFIEVSVEDTGTAAIVDVLAIASSDGYDVATSSTALTIMPMKLNSSLKSNCTAVGVITGNGTTPYTGNYVEFWRGVGGFAEDAFNGNTSPGLEQISRCAWNYNDAETPPLIIGQGTLSVYASTQAPTHFITVAWIEIPTSAIE